MFLHAPCVAAPRLCWPCSQRVVSTPSPARSFCLVYHHLELQVPGTQVLQYKPATAAAPTTSPTQM